MDNLDNFCLIIIFLLFMADLLLSSANCYWPPQKFQRIPDFLEQRFLVESRTKRLFENAIDAAATSKCQLQSLFPCFPAAAAYEITQKGPDITDPHLYTVSILNFGQNLFVFSIFAKYKSVYQIRHCLIIICPTLQYFGVLPPGPAPVAHNNTSLKVAGSDLTAAGTNSSSVTAVSQPFVATPLWASTGNTSIAGTGPLCSRLNRTSTQAGRLLPTR